MRGPALFALRYPGTVTAVPGLWRLAAAIFLKTAIAVRPRLAIGSRAGLEKPGVELGP